MGWLQKFVSLVTFSVALSLLAVSPGIAAGSDFDDDGTSDILFQHSDDGRLLLWQMNNLARTNVKFVKSLANSWAVVGKGDFNADGTTDVLYMKDAGDTAIAEMRNAERINLKFPGGINPVWSVQGVGDFNGDGSDDILWRRSTDGITMIWGITNSVRTQVSFSGGLSSFWVVAGIGDFNNDGTDDILYQHNTDGRLLIWQLNNYGRTTVKFAKSLANTWVVVGVGDFNADGTSDVLYRKDAGDVAIAEFSNLNRSALRFPGGIGTVWSVKGVGDYDGDGVADILFRRSTDNVTAVWGLSNSARTGLNFPGGLVGQWVVMGNIKVRPETITLTGTLSNDYTAALEGNSLLDNIVSMFISRAYANNNIKEVRAIPITERTGFLSEELVREIALGTIVSPISEDGNFDIDLPKRAGASLQKWLLVLIDETENIAGFINIEENENKLYSLPTSGYSEDKIELGSVYKDGDDAVSLDFNIRDFSDSHLYTEEQILQLANVNLAYKSIAHMLEKCDTSDLDNISCFEYNLYFDFSGEFADIIDTYGYANTLQGYSVHVGAKSNHSFSGDFAGIVDGTVVYELYPENGQVFTNQGAGYSIDNPISTEAEIKIPSSTSDGFLYFTDSDGDTYVNNGDGSGLGISFATINTFPIPQHWSLDRNGTAYEKFNLSHALPIDRAGNPQLLYPSVKMELEPGEDGPQRVSAINVKWYQKIGNAFVPADKAINRELISEYNVTLYDPNGVTGNISSHAVNFYNEINVERIDTSQAGFFHNNPNEDNYTVHSVTVGYWFSGNYYAFLWYNGDIL